MCIRDSIYIETVFVVFVVFVVCSFPAPFRQRPRAERSASRRRRRIHNARIESKKWCCFWRRMAFKSWTNPDGGREGPKREKVRRARRINFGGYARVGIAHHSILSTITGENPRAFEQRVLGGNATSFVFFLFVREKRRHSRRTPKTVI